MRKLSLLVMLALIGNVLYAQSPKTEVPPRWEHRLHAEAGFTYPKGSIKEHLAIRQNVSSYYVYQSSQGQVYSDIQGFDAAVRWEIFNTRYRFGLSAGLRYTSFNTIISGYTSSTANFFYLRYLSSGTDTKFARVKSITETTKLIGVPLEINYAPFILGSFRCFVKAGIEPMSYRFQHHTGIEFENPEMAVNEEEVVAGFSEPVSTLCSRFYSTLGVMFAKPDKAGITFEVLLPSVFLSNDNFNLAEVDRYSGFRASIHLPVR